MKKFLQKNKGLYLFISVLSILSAVFMTLFSLQLGKILDGIAISSGALTTRIVVCVIILGVWFLSSWAFSFFRSLYIQKILSNLKNKLFEVFFNRQFKDIHDKEDSDFYNDVTKNIDLIQEDYLIPRTDVVSNLFSMIASVAAIIYIEWRLALVFLLVSLMTIVLSQLPGKLMEKATNQYSTKSKGYLDKVTIFLKGFEQIKLLQIQKFIYSKLLNINVDFEDSRKKYQYTKDISSDIGMFLGFFSQVLCMTAGIFFVRKDLLTIGSLIASVQLLNGVFGPLQSFMYNRNLIKSTKPIVENVESSLLIDDTATNTDVQLQDVHEIQVNHLTYKTKDKTLYDDFSFQFVRGKKYAIIGESGKGKSTLAKLILNYYPNDNYQGTITIDNAENSTISPDNLYEKIAYVQKNNFILEGSVLENIQMNRDLALSQDMKEALGFNENFLSQELSTTLDVISQGEKQRIDLARFFIKKYHAYIFDEPTSNLDPERSKLVLDYILSIPDAIVIVITHQQDEQVLNQFDEVIRL